MIREKKRSQYTLGTLSIEGEPFCRTLEPTWRGREGWHVPGRTAIPTGRYPVAVTFSAKHGLWLPVLLHVPHFSSVRIAEGSSAADTDGDILVGIARPTCHGQLFGSHFWTRRLVRRLAERPLGEGVWLTVRWMEFV